MPRKPAPRVVAEDDSMGPLQTAGLIIFGIGIVFCSMETVPGWGIFNLGWPKSTFFIIMAVIGAVSGVLVVRGYPIPGLIGGLVAGVGSLGATTFMLERMNVTHSVLMMLAGGIGCLPGVLLGFGGKVVQDMILPPGEKDDDEEDEFDDEDDLDDEDEPRPKRRR